MLAAAAILARAVLGVLLLRVAWSDLGRQKIANRDVLVIALVGAGLLLQPAAGGSWANFAIGAAAGALFFLVLVPFWLIGKVGAGDVKLMGAAALVAGGDYLLSFALALIVFTLITALLVKMPMLLPETLYKRYVALFADNNVVPFGVPISAALLVVLLLQIAGVRV
ncbi:prepilin peptidase [Nitratireductor luteus]|uniref:prepilin peptidase n=1 Tax=Nitratireductor luteus TaxID=2976980 RepID=UPI00223ECD9F|nr:prepilin peptidase [Nitratireductor luteus]